jgi:hypothetical protein
VLRWNLAWDAPSPLSAVRDGLKENSTYLIEQAKIGRDIRSESMDERQDLIFVAPEQFVNRVSHKELLLIGFQHGLNEHPEEAGLGPFYDSLRRRGKLRQECPLLPSHPHPTLSYYLSTKGARNQDVNVEIK